MIRSLVGNSKFSYTINFEIICIKISENLLKMYFDLKMVI